MGYLPGHLSPCSFTFTFCEGFSAFFQFSNHLVILLYQNAYFIIPLPFYFFIHFSEINIPHFLANDRKGGCNPVGNEQSDSTGYKKYECIQVYNSNEEVRNFLFQFALGAIGGYV